VLLHDPAAHLARGYADLPAKLAQLGMAAERLAPGSGQESRPELVGSAPAR
jgi:hypothetical protein